jgi:multiple sugar transport system permease protein
MARRRTVTALLSAGMVLAAVLATPAEPPARVHIRAESLPPAGDAGVGALARRTVHKAFLDEHPNFDIEPFRMPDIQGMESATLTSVAAGVPPHIMYVNVRLSSTYLAQGFLEPLEVLLARKLSADERVRRTDGRGRWLADPQPEDIARAVELLRARVPPRAWAVVYRDDESGVDLEKHVWAVPWGNLVIALLCRRDLFTQAGLDPDRPPTTWDELLDYARRLTVPERRQYGIMAGGGDDISWWAYSFLVSNGARAVEQDAGGRWRAAYGTREAAEAVMFAWRLLKEPWTRQADGKVIEGTAAFGTGADQYLLWSRGQIGMYFDYIREELISTINPQLVTIAPVPKAPRGARGSEFNCEMFGIFSGSPPVEKLAAMDYLWFITSDEAKRIRTEVYVESGYGQFVSPDLLAKFGYEGVLRRVPAGWKATFEEAMDNGVPEPYGRDTLHVYRYLSEPINASLELPLAGMPAGDALDRIEGLLVKSADEVNVRFLGQITPETMRFRRGVAFAVTLAMALVFCLGMVSVWRYFTVAAQADQVARSWRRLRWGIALVVPAVGLIAMWQYIPLVGGLRMSFLDYQLIRHNTWVGLDNFAAVLFDEKFWAAFARTGYFVSLMIGLGFWPPILLALLLQEVPTDTAKYVFRTIYYLPAVVSGVVVMFLWKQLYDPSEYGVLNQLWLGLNRLGPVGGTLVKLLGLALWGSLTAVLLMLPLKARELSAGMKAASWALAAALIAAALWPLARALRDAGAGGVAGTLSHVVGPFDLKPLRWAQSPEMAMLCVVIPTIWAGSGPGCIIYLAALKTVPDELYEAAAIDGASHWHKVLYIVLPRLKYLIVIQFISAVIGAFKGGTDLILALTGGGPNEATKILPLEIFVRTFADLRFGIGTAMAWILGALLIGFTAWQLRMLSRAEFRTGA